MNKKDIEKLRELGINSECMGSCLFVLKSLLINDLESLNAFEDYNSFIVYKELEKIGLLELNENNKFQLTTVGRIFIENIDSNSEKSTIKKPVLTLDWIKEWVNLWKDEKGIFYKDKQMNRTLGCSEKDAYSKMILFLIEYKYLFENLSDKFTIKDIIINSTKNYIERYKKNNFAFCKNANYFIIKQEGKSKIFNNSTLATECENYINNPIEEKENKDNFGITLN